MLSSLSLPWVLAPSVLAQSIVPTTGTGATGTQIIQNGNQLDIQGGTLSSDGANLFHSFQKFGLSQDQIANFQAMPQIRNILGRVVGGDASVIDGLIRVSGGNANLYLMNPAGIVFGANARLDVPAAFTATTATGMGFGNGGWFSAVGGNDYAALTGTPNRFAFTASPGGAIVNFGNLSVTQGQSLTLLAGTLLNIGDLSAPGGQITLAAVPGQTLVRLSQAGSLLNLEFQPLGATVPNPLPFTPPSLAQLLTGGTLGNATGVSVNANGTIQLTGSNLAIPAGAGTAIVSGQVSVANSASANSSLLTPAITLLGQQVGLFNAHLDASGVFGGGVIRIGGDYQGQGTLPQATATYVSPDTTIRADSGQQGNGGRVIVWATDSTRVYGSISAQGGPQGGDGGLIETSGKNFLDVTGVSIQAGAPLGKAGLWLLDPHNVTIRDTLPSGGSLDGGNPDIFTPTADDAIVSTHDITTALNNGVNVTITTGTTGTQAGNLTVDSPLLITPIGGPTLKLEAAGTIAVNQTIASTGALNLVFKAGDAIVLNAPVKTDGGNFTSTSLSLTGLNQVNTAGPNRVGSLNIQTAAGSTNQGQTAQQQIARVVTPPDANHPPGNTPGDRNQPHVPNGPTAPGQNQGSGDLQAGSPRQAEQALRAEFVSHLRPPGNLTQQVSSEATLNQVQVATGVKPALIYFRFVPSVVATESKPAVEVAGTKELQAVNSRVLSSKGDGKSLAQQLADQRAQTETGEARPDDQLELILVTANGVSIPKRVAGATRRKVLAVARSFIHEVSDPRKVYTTTYLAPAQQLYRWLIAPLEPELQARQITNLAFISVTGLRFIPLAALHDGHQFLVEKYSVGLMPSLSLTDTRYASLKNAQVLAAGASTFAEQPPLPAVPTELSVITHQLWQGRSLLNSAFTLSNLKAERQQHPFQIVHLATHGEFEPGAADNSYIQLWDGKLQLDHLRDLGWNDPPVELLVLSACRTALGSDDAELGFAGFALQAGVKSALASLWYISDEGTLAFMSEFYQQLRTAPIKAEALRRTQLAMLQGKVKIEAGQLRSSRGGEITLPPVLSTGDRSLAHPFYWAAFTLIGSPW